MAEQSRRVAAQETRFIEAYVATGDLVGSAQKAGYSRPRETVAKLMRRRDVVVAVKTAALSRLYSEGAWVAANTLIEIAGDTLAPKNARVAAAKGIADIIGFGSVGAEIMDKPLSEMTRSELSEARDRAVAYLAELERPTLELTASEAPADEADDDGEPPLTGGLFD